MLFKSMTNFFHLHVPHAQTKVFIRISMVVMKMNITDPTAQFLNPLENWSLGIAVNMANVKTCIHLLVGDSGEEGNDELRSMLKHVLQVKLDASG